jgi:hypothetical protein
MGLESVTYINDLVTTNPVGATDPKSEGDDHIRNIKAALKNCFPGLAGAAFRVQAKTANYTAIATDNSTLLAFSSTATTLSLTAAATLGNQFLCFVYNGTTGALTIDPNGAELVNGVSTISLLTGQACILACTGSGFHAFVIDSLVQPVPMMVKRKASDESVTSSTTLQDDDDLQFAIGANETWVGSIELWVGDALSTTGIKFSVDTPAGSAGKVSWLASQYGNGIHAFNSTVGVSTTVDYVAGYWASVTGSLRIEFSVANGATAGNAKLKWAQSTSSGTALKVLSGSNLRASRVS